MVAKKKGKAKVAKKTKAKAAPKKARAKAKKKAASPKAAPEEKKSCFTIMPFGGWFDDYYETIYAPAINAAGLNPKRADDLYRPSTIVNDIWQMTQEAEIVLADLTGKNPNVFYELGLAHAIAKPAILITESMDDVPFDLRSLRVLEYNKNIPNWGEKLGDDITNAIEEITNSPLDAVLPAFVSVTQSPRLTVSDAAKDLLELRQDFELFKREVRRRPAGGRVRVPEFSSPDEAREYSTRNFGKMPKGMLRKRLIDRGAPLEWVEDLLMELSSFS